MTIDNHKKTDNPNYINKFGFTSMRGPPQQNNVTAFENDLTNIMTILEIRISNNNFERRHQKAQKMINNSKHYL